ncbi:SGNH/GDSL hydrolase family protein [Anoxybacillus eryuanensis]|uniref:SGNH/GDSL hydrolase family protein n=1 Tax=Anoxybacillus eryuanensis TaxID=651866 RepID=UPI003EF29E36
MASYKTPNIGLNKWAETDYFKRIEVNENFDKIDDQFSKVNDKIGILSNRIDRNEKFFIPRHSYIYNALKSGTIIKGVVIGDSNGAGAGASSYAENWIWKLTKKIRTFANIGTNNDFAIRTYAVGSQNIRQSIPFVAYTMNGKRTYRMKMKEKYPYLIIMTGLNDSSGNPVPLDEFEWLYRLTVRTAIEKGIDVFCCTETCGVDMTTGLMKESAESLYAPYRDVIIQIAEQEGASLVDINLKFRRLYEQGIDIRQYFADGTHLNDSGQEIVADLIYQCITTTSIGGARKINPNEQQKYKYVPTVLLDYDYSSNASYVTDITLSNGGLRDINDKANFIKISSGGYVDFNLPSFPWYAILVTVVMKASTGILTVQSRIGLNLNGGGNVVIPNHLNVNAETTLIFYAGSQSSEIRNGIRLLANNGDVYISGITVLSHTLICEHTPKPVPTSLTGTWTNYNYSPTYQQILSSKNVGDKLTFRWYGTAIEFGMIFSPQSGQVKITTDGDSITRDLYSTGILEVYNSNQKTYPLGWHTTEIEVLTKNAASSDNYVGVTNVKIYSCKNNDNTIVARANNGVKIYADIIDPKFVAGTLDYTIVDNVITVTNDSVLEVKPK